MRSIYVFLLLGLASSVLCPAQTMFRGDARHTGTTQEKGPATLHGIKWSFATSARSLASPVLDQGTLFIGSDDHAESTGHIFSLIASARLHQLDPEAYLRDLFRVLAHWPRDRYLELAPKYWAATRARLDETELAREVGWLTIPPPSE